MTRRKPERDHDAEQAARDRQRGGGTSKETGMTKREVLDTGTDKRYARRDEEGRFTEDQSDVGKSLTTDRRRRADTIATPGQGDRGDRRK